MVALRLLDPFVSHHDRNAYRPFLYVSSDDSVSVCFFGFFCPRKNYYVSIVGNQLIIYDVLAELNGIRQCSQHS